MDSPNLILAGPTGVGKSSVGRSLAGRLGMRFLDFDSEIEKQFGIPISDIFSRFGEPTFRAAESEMCNSLEGQRGIVAATGGGAVVSEANREALRRAGIVVCLTCAPGVLLERLTANGGIGTRPLLMNNPEIALRQMLFARQAAYGAIPLQIDTTELSLLEVVDAVYALYNAVARRSPVEPKRSADWID